jgi:hypothetical protein
MDRAATIFDFVRHVLGLLLLHGAVVVDKYKGFLVVGVRFALCSRVPRAEVALQRISTA